MAESLAQRLQRIAREKAASAAGGASAPVAQPTQVTKAQITEEVSDVTQDGLAQIQGESSDAGSSTKVGGEAGAVISNDVQCAEVRAESHSNTSSEVESNNSLVSVIEHSDSLPIVASVVTAEPSTHPLAMAFAELEAGLLARDPEFKTKLRDIHRHLGREPELVTQMTEAEIALIVTGMVVFANAEIVEPAAKKAQKSAVKAASKVVISADDL
ncbi:MAG: hypothetical protein [Bacteriophage sp.]|nr:MAG: hypothetical protein [Bacteriophage sp.]